jgi:hypothetical protein
MSPAISGDENERFAPRLVASNNLAESPLPIVPRMPKARHEAERIGVADIVGGIGPRPLAWKSWNDKLAGADGSQVSLMKGG